MLFCVRFSFVTFQDQNIDTATFTAAARLLIDLSVGATGTPGHALQS